eukprot:45840-Prorocentrum_minimum.AAC.1
MRYIPRYIPLEPELCVPESDIYPIPGGIESVRAGIFLKRGPIARGERAYSSNGDQSREASGHIPQTGTNSARRAGIFLALIYPVCWDPDLGYLYSIAHPRTQEDP